MEPTWYNVELGREMKEQNKVVLRYCCIVSWTKGTIFALHSLVYQ